MYGRGKKLRKTKTQNKTISLFISKKKKEEIKDIIIRDIRTLSKTKKEKIERRKLEKKKLVKE